MISAKQQLIAKELEDGTGAKIGLALDNSGLRSAMRIWFDDLDERHGPVATISPHGLKSHRVRLAFGDRSGAVIRQIQNASFEDVQLARALLSSIEPSVGTVIHNQSLEDWSVQDGSFEIVATIRHEDGAGVDDAVSRTCRQVVVPMMAAMAELVGYDTIEKGYSPEEPVFEGAISPAVVNRRERNPRNRLLCIRLHGQICAACGMDPHSRYGMAGGIIEVHHLEPLSLLQTPRTYNPARDLVPLCPSCHRAVHTQRPVPIAVEALKCLMDAQNV